MKMHSVRMRLVFTGALALLAIGLVSNTGTAQTPTSHYFPETRHTVKGLFLTYWQEHGALAQQGYPLSEEFTEVNDLDGKPYTIQYFERAVFESHPENKPPYNVLLSQLGTFQYRAKYGDAGAPSQQPHTGGQLFKETGHYAGGTFLEYWKSHGGLAQQGFPISEEFTEVSDLDRKPYLVQYFERAVFEYHPENKPPYDVLLSQLGTFQLRSKYPSGPPGGEGSPVPTAVATTPPARPSPTSSTPKPTRTPGGTNCSAVPDSRKSTVSHAGPVAISNVQYVGQEFVELKNTGGDPTDISKWVLRDKNDPNQQYAFPDGTHLSAGATLQVYTEPGHEYTFNSRSAIWNNCGDALELLDASGAVVATYAYGTHLLP
ncbi:MAG: lamin tail domain-containing protein [Chloroflexia bacterium]